MGTHAHAERRVQSNTGARVTLNFYAPFTLHSWLPSLITHHHARLSSSSAQQYTSFPLLAVSQHTNFHRWAELLTSGSHSLQAISRCSALSSSYTPSKLAVMASRKPGTSSVRKQSIAGPSRPAMPSSSGSHAGAGEARRGKEETGTNVQVVVRVR